MNSQDFPTEGQFQKLIAKYPNLLAGGQIDQDNPRRWLLIGRELGLASEEDGSERWSVDHLFLDQDGIPTIVEVKRSSDTRIRREIVGQMLDYAANCVVYWPIDKLKQKFNERLIKEKKDPDEEISNFLNLQIQPDEFWEKVKTNLKTGNIRLLFVADEIPKELKRIVEFLNERMYPTEVLAVQLKQYASGDHKVLVPTVFGQTSATVDKKTKPDIKWDVESFLNKIKETKGEKEANIAKEIINYFDSKGLVLGFNKGVKTPSLAFYFTCRDETEFWNFAIWLHPMKQKEHLKFTLNLEDTDIFQDNEVLLKQYLEKINSIPNMDITEDVTNKSFFRDITLLEDPNNLHIFLKTNEWAIEQIKQHHAKKE